MIKLWNIDDPVYKNYAKVMWSDYGKGLEKVRDLEVINASR